MIYCHVSYHHDPFLHASFRHNPYHYGPFLRGPYLHDPYRTYVQTCPYSPFCSSSWTFFLEIFVDGFHPLIATFQTFEIDVSCEFRPSFQIIYLILMYSHIHPMLLFHLQELENQYCFEP